MDFNAKQMREDALIREGRYHFRVLRGQEKTSSNGNDMMNLKLMINVHGRDVQFFDTLLFMPTMFWKVEHFCKATGMEQKIDDGRLMAQDCDGRDGVLDISHRVNKQTGEVEAFVKDYISPEKLEAQAQEEAPAFDDDVPDFGAK
jgi:hypothetical protein